MQSGTTPKGGGQMQAFPTKTDVIVFLTSIRDALVAVVNILNTLIMLLAA